MCTRSRSQRALRRKHAAMPWDEGLVNSLVYDKPDPSEGRVVSYAQAINEALDAGARSTIPACSCSARASTIRRRMFGTTRGLHAAIRSPTACSTRRCPKKAMMGVSRRRRDERHAAGLHAQPAGLRAAGLQPARHARRQVPLHGQRPDDGADGRLGGHRPRLGIRRAAFAGHPRHAARRARAEDRDAQHAVRCEGPAARRRFSTTTRSASSSTAG